MFIIFDSNIWIAELGLNSKKGSAVRFFIKQNKAIVALPEVIKLEVESNVKKSINTFVSNIEKNHRQLLTLFGNLKEVVLPNEKIISERTKGIFINSGLDILDLPFTLESARNSFSKIIEKTPPSDKSQQFKDGVIWADCIKLLYEDDVFLVTEDKAFYQDRDYRKGLSGSLMSEIAMSKYRLSIFSNLSELLDEIKSEIDIDKNKLASTYYAQSKQSIDNIAIKNEFVLEDPPTVDVTAYVTEDPNTLFIEFELIYKCNDSSNKNREVAIVRAAGDGLYNTDTKDFHNLKNLEEGIIFYDESNEKQSNKNIYLRVDGIVIGHRESKHTVKAKIDL